MPFWQRGIMMSTKPLLPSGQPSDSRSEERCAGSDTKSIQKRVSLAWRHCRQGRIQACRLGSIMDVEQGHRVLVCDALLRARTSAFRLSSGVSC